MAEPLQAYNFKTIEPKWQKKWEENNLFHTDLTSTSAPFYCLVMFPYPSGKIHMGHVRNYTIGDVISRYKRMQGFNVFHPIGWDSFGLPAENAAIEHKIDPKSWTENNISQMRNQLKRLGFSYNWKNEISTCSETYHRWNQWFFIKMFERGLVYRKKSPVNWCGDCQTVLANEQVHNGRCWRCETEITFKDLEQWFIKISQYAERLLDDHKILENKWPDEVLTMQKNWIGKSEGAEIIFPLVDNSDVIKVFTTRADTLFGATFVVLSPQHPLVSKIAKTKEVNEFVKSISPINQSTTSKKGVFTGSYAINPINNKKIPVWVSDYVLMEYGTGAIMSVPAHDQRDFEFAKENNLPIVWVIKPKDGHLTEDSAFVESGIMFNCEKFSGMDSTRGAKAVTEYLQKKGFAKFTVNYRLKDWLISRQRYWGTPIPIIYCDNCGVVTVPEKDLPVKLPDNVKFTGKGESPLKYVEEFVNCKCPRCNSKAKRETDTMDTFFDSSWYYLRYLSPDDDTKAFDSEIAKNWIPVHQYIGGIEHACMHLIYSRFFHKFLYDIGLVNSKEPFERLLTQGMVTLGGSAMSKSKGNIVEPEKIIEKYGADTARLFILFASPPQNPLEWQEKGVEGCWRFIKRVIRLVEDYIASPSQTKSTNILKTTHRYLKKVTDDLEAYKFNTAIASIMEFVNELYKNFSEITDETIETLLLMLTPFAPHISEELWEKIGKKGFISLQRWPKYSHQLATKTKVEIPVQINGKIRTKFIVEYNIPEEELKNIIFSDKKIKKHIDNKKIIKTIYIKNRIFNIVTDNK